MLRYVVGIQRFENIYEDLVFCFILFFLFSKIISVFNMYFIYYISRFFISKVFNKRVVIELMSEIYIVDKGKWCESNEFMLILMFELELYYFFKILDVLYCCYIFGVILDQFWVNGNEKNFILINIKGDKLNQLQDVCVDDIVVGVYIVDFVNNLIYIDKDYNLNKLLINMKIFIIFFKSIFFMWKLCCLYWFKCIVSLLVGMYMEKYLWCGKIIWYNYNGEVM